MAKPFAKRFWKTFGEAFGQTFFINVSTFGPPGGLRGQTFTKRLRSNVSTFGPPRGFRVLLFSSTTSASYKGTVSEMFCKQFQNISQVRGGFLCVKEGKTLAKFLF